jgi:hypothetical protein
MREFAVLETEKRYRDKNPLIRIREDVHETLIKYSNETGIPIKDIASDLILENIREYVAKKKITKIVKNYNRISYFIKSSD